MNAVIPLNEPERLAAVRRYDILDTPPDGAFDRITAIAARLFRVPIAIVSIVDHDRIWFKSHHGLDVRQIGRDPGLCASAILQDGAWVLTDAKHDLRALANPLVAGEFGLRFYAGVPLRTSDGFNLGTLCVIDREPREVTDDEMAHLRDLAAVVVDELELRLAVRRALGRYEEELAERRRREAELEAVAARLKDAVVQKEVLLREVHHRVKNNLQVVVSLVNLQGAGAPPEIRQRFDQILSRVASIARLHEQCYQGDDAASVDLLTYLNDVARTVVEAYGLAARVACRAEGQPLRIDLDRGTPLGLIATEVVTNACKHAFPDKRRGAIGIGLEQDDERFVLRIRDDGIGLPSRPHPGSGSMGLRLVDMLARQLQGTYRFDSNGGTVFTLAVPRRAA